MSEKPRRQCHLTLDLQADDRLELARVLDDIGTRILCEDFAIEGVSGGVGSGYTFAYSEDAEWTHDRYFDAVGELLAKSAPVLESRQAEEEGTHD